MVGGMISSTILTLVVIPAIYSNWKERALARRVLGVEHASTPSAIYEHSGSKRAEA
jgi:hypothetical protein